MKNILIAEDERPMAKALEVKLRKVGYNAKAVFDGAQALAEIEKTQYHLVLLDLIMPETDGFDVLAKIKVKNIPVIVVSNLSQEEDIAKAKNLGANDFLIKSNVSLAEIVEIAKKTLGD